MLILRDREEAGRLLAERLSAYRDDPQALILALPRGGVPVGYMLSLALHLPLDVLIVRKLGAPGNPEYAVGAVAEGGALYLNREGLRDLGLGREDLNKPIRVQEEEITRRQALYRGGRSLPQMTGKTIVLVDDGIATGSTFFASIAAVKKLKPDRLVAAIPVGPRETLLRVQREVDALVCLMTPEPFFAVGNHYEEFAQVEDAAVVRYLQAAAASLREGPRASRA
ncbi:MAG: phosphoribosyltransferase [Nitrospirae bacterium]|nr:MAG: phosphoribosyltransferase [Nitrospirota bacterium]